MLCFGTAMDMIQAAAPPPTEDDEEVFDYATA